MKPKQLIHDGDRGFQSTVCYIHGFQQCCSAAILHGLSGYPQTVRIPKVAPINLPTVDMDRLPNSFEEYVRRFSKKNQIFAMPYDHAMCSVLEAVYNKAQHGEGGTNMYASSRYATKTWFIADRRRNEGSISCMNFMHWLKAQGVRKVGRIHISPYRDGAHGGECKGAVYAPDLPKVRAFLDEKFEELISHVLWVKEFYGNIKAADIKAADEVADLW